MGCRARVGSRAAEQTRRPAGSRPRVASAPPMSLGGNAGGQNAATPPAWTPGLRARDTVLRGRARRLHCGTPQEHSPSLPANGESARQSVRPGGARVLHGDVALLTSAQGRMRRGRRGLSAASSAARRAGRGCRALCCCIVLHQGKNSCAPSVWGALGPDPAPWPVAQRREAAAAKAAAAAAARADRAEQQRRAEAEGDIVYHTRKRASDVGERAAEAAEKRARRGAADPPVRAGGAAVAQRVGLPRAFATWAPACAGVRRRALAPRAAAPTESRVRCSLCGAAHACEACAHAQQSRGWREAVQYIKE